MNAILTYHSIDGSGSPISVSPSAFRRQIAWLAASGVRVASVAEVHRAPASGHTVALTFDDAYRSVATEAAPVLAEYGFAATIFVVTQRTGGSNDWRAAGDGTPALSLLDWDALGALEARGFGIASHTRTHARLPGLDGARLEDEISGAAHDLERRLGAGARGFAYPYGELDAAARAAVARVHAWACATRFADTAAEDDPLALPRLDMWYFERPGLFETFGSPAFARWVRRRRALRGLRAGLRRLAPFRT